MLGQTSHVKLQQHAAPQTQSGLEAAKEAMGKKYDEVAAPERLQFWMISWLPIYHLSSGRMHVENKRQHLRKGIRNLKAFGGKYTLTWAHLEKKTDKTPTYTNIFFRIMLSAAGDGRHSLHRGSPSHFHTQPAVPRSQDGVRMHDRNDILMFQQHHRESLSEAWILFKDLLQKVPYHGIDLWLQVQIFYDHVNPVTRRTNDQSVGGKLRDLKAKESWALLEDLALYDNESWNDPRDFAIDRGPHDTQYCMKDLEQAFVEYTSSRTDEAGGRKPHLLEEKKIPSVGVFDEIRANKPPGWCSDWLDTTSPHRDPQVVALVQTSKVMFIVWHFHAFPM
ncbi:hypothetical protein Tco_0468611, partial [Tanacetum coccineum]